MSDTTRAPVQGASAGLVVDKAGEQASDEKAGAFTTIAKRASEKAADRRL